MLWLTLLVLISVLQGSHVCMESHDRSHNNVGASSERHWDYIILGAGPAGLQMGHHLHKAGRDYVIMEKGNTSGHFFTRYPRHDKLISINKRYTGKRNKEFNMRHDWNSILSDDERLLFKEFSQEFFPHRESMLAYLNTYSRFLGLNIRHNHEISHIRREVNDTSEDATFYMEDQRGNMYSCRTLIVATGIWKPNIPHYEGIEQTEGYESISTNPRDYEGKTVLVLGHGNAAFETADAIYGYANGVHMAGRSRVRLAWETHYVGDLRGVNNALLDTYQLKSLDGVVEGPFRDVRFETSSRDRKLRVRHYGDSDQDNFALRDGYDIIIRCLGFLFDDDIFDNDTKPLRGFGKKYKYPLISPDYQVVNVPNMYVIGTAAHSLDYRRSAGGFIHGFRYNVRVLHRLLSWRNHGNPWPSHSVPIGDLLNYVVKRMNEASATYQMFGELGDVLAFRADGTVEILEEVPLALLSSFPSITGRKLDHFLVLLTQYGRNFSGPGKDVFREARATGFANEAHRSNFLHPVLYYYEKLPTEAEMTGRPSGWPLPRPKRLHHVVEDFLTSWDGPNTHILPLRRFIETALNRDLRHFYAADCLKMALLHKAVPHSCQQSFLSGRGLVDEYANEEKGEMLKSCTRENCCVGCDAVKCSPSLVKDSLGSGHQMSAVVSDRTVT